MQPTFYWFLSRPTINITFSFTNNYSPQQFVNFFCKIVCISSIIMHKCHLTPFQKFYAPLSFFFLFLFFPSLAFIYLALSTKIYFCAYNFYIAIIMRQMQPKQTVERKQRNQRSRNIQTMLTIVCAWGVWWAFFATLGQIVSYHITAQWIWRRKVETRLTTTHPKSAYAQARTPLLGPWTCAHGREYCQKKVMVDRCTMTKIRKTCLLSAQKQTNKQTKSFSQ